MPAPAFDPSFAMTILFVDSPADSARFYRRLLDAEPLEESPTFAMFRLPNGAHLGLWRRTTAEPHVAAPAGGAELCLVTADVDGVHAEWAARGAAIAQPPTDMDFGRTFVALDPDGHRLRVFRPDEAPRAA
jgi:predicted enzyme related to lactoylglutathione lyase